MTFSLPPCPCPKHMPAIPACGAFRIPIWCIPTPGLTPIRGSIPLWHPVVVNPTPVGLWSAAGATQSVAEVVSAMHLFFIKLHLVPWCNG